MANSTIEIKGLSELKARLAALPTEVQNSVVKSALKKAAKPIVDQAKQLAPRGNNPGGRWRTLSRGDKVNYGTLVENIKARLLPRRQADRTTVMITLGDAFWGLFQERVTRKKGSGRHQFLGPAFSGQINQAASILRNEIRSGIERAVKKLARR